MNSIHNNPFRIAGILANSSEKDIQRQKSKITRYTEVGKEVTSEYDFSFLNNIARNNAVIDKAFSDIEQNQSRINHALFWFVNSSPVDATAIQHLISGNKEKALEIWEKLVTDKEVTAKNFSAFNNIGTLYFLEGSKSGLEKGIAAKLKLIESDHFTDFAHSVADATFSPNTQKQTELLVDQIFSDNRNTFSPKDLLPVFNSNASAKKYASQKVTQEPVKNIEAAVEEAKKSRAANKLGAYQKGKNLYTKTKSDLALLASVVGKTDLQYKMLADNVAKEVLQCSIDYFNENQEQDRSGDYLKEAMDLALLAKSVAVNSVTVERINDNIATLEGMKDRELDSAITFLNSIKSTLAENRKSITADVKRLEANDWSIKMGYKSINWSAVEDNIKNSINWDAVNDLLTEILPESNLRKIKASEKEDLKKEFWELLNWTRDNSLRSTPVSRIIDNYKNIPAKLNFEITSAEITNEDKESNTITTSFYIENIRYVGLKLNIKSLGSQNVTIYKKYISPQNTYSHSSKVSPAGYTTSDDYKITTSTKSLYLGGWGNADKCTYEVGEHKIEVYVDHYKVFTKTFNVDWSPNKKVELTRNLLNLKNELKEVEKFKWFRGAETKEKEVKEVKDKIAKAEKILMNK